MTVTSPGAPEATAAAAAATIRRRYVQAGDRLVHLRHAGTGPAVVLLHDSPRSSRLHLPLMQVLAASHTVIALDTPGYGNSDPLGTDQPAMAAFGAALGETLSALGLERAPLYATHTSAKIALAWADQGGRPARLVLDGLSMPTQLAEEAFIDRYMRPFAPDPSGGYLASEWTRLRDMLRWFPWFATEPAARVAMAPPAPEWIEDYAIDLFSAERHYADAYAAAMRFDPAPALARVAVPTLVAAREDDVLHGYLERAANCGNPLVTTRSLPADRAIWLDWLRATLGSDGPAGWTPPAPGRSARRAYADCGHTQVHLTRFGPESGLPWLVLSTPTTLHGLNWGRALGAHGPAIVPDLPGFGESDPLAQNDPAALADLLAEVIGTLGERRIGVLGIGLAAPLAALLARRLPEQVAALAIDGLPPADPAGAARFARGLCPPLDFDPQAGSHLHRIWHLLRDAEVQWPWHDPAPAAARRLPPLFEAEALHGALTGILKQRANWGQSALAALAAGPALAGPVPVPALVFTHADPAYRDAPELARRWTAGTVARPAGLADAATLVAHFAASIPEPA